MKKITKLLSVLILSVVFIAQGFSQVSLKDIQSRGKLIIGTTGTQPPYSMISVSGDPMGFEIELAQALAGAMGVELEIKTMKFDELLTAVETGKW